MGVSLRNSVTPLFCVKNNPQTLKNLRIRVEFIYVNKKIHT